MTTRTAPSAFHIPSLDGIRACAFLLVFLGHAGVPGIPGGFGVTIFFFLSGYLITTLLRLERERTGHISFKLFYLRRVLRILPPFYLVLLASVLLTLSGISPGTLQFRAVLSQALHYSNYWAIYRTFQGTALGTGVYWSLAIEEHFYALFPALYVLLLGAKLSGRGQRTVFLGICAAVLAWRSVLILVFHAAALRTYLGTDTRLDSLLFGCALAVAGNPMLDVPAREKPEKSFVLLACGALGLLLVSFIVRDDRFRETLRYTLQGVALYPLFYGAIRFPKWGLFPLFNGRLVRFLGKLSYSLYLVHGVIFGFLEPWLPAAGPIIRGMICLALSVMVSWLIWIAIEKPAARLRKSLESSARELSPPVQLERLHGDGSVH